MQVESLTIKRAQGCLAHCLPAGWSTGRAPPARCAAPWRSGPAWSGRSAAQLPAGGRKWAEAQRSRGEGRQTAVAAAWHVLLSQSHSRHSSTCAPLTSGTLDSARFLASVRSTRPLSALSVAGISAACNTLPASSSVRSAVQLCGARQESASSAWRATAVLKHPTGATAGACKGAKVCWQERTRQQEGRRPPHIAIGHVQQLQVRQTGRLLGQLRLRQVISGQQQCGKVGQRGQRGGDCVRWG